MTNAQIIFNASMELMKAGTIGTTGRTFTYETETGETITVQEPEPIHTYAAWQEKGYQVRKGEKAIAAITIWKQGKAYVTKDKETGEEVQKDGRMFQKTAYFFKASQVDKIEKQQTA